VREYAVDILNSRRELLVMSVGAFVDEKLLKDVRQAASNNRVNVYIPSGALCGVDGLKAAAVEGIEEVVLTSTKPPSAFTGVKYLEEKGMDANSFDELTVLYEGYASEAARLFPKNINVSAILSLAGVGAKKTKVKIVVDPGAKMNSHEVSVKGSFGELIAKTYNLPSPDNPKTSYLACLSAIRVLENLCDNIRVGN
jgi:aspartate dehydrogenase